MEPPAPPAHPVTAPSTQKDDASTKRDQPVDANDKKLCASLKKQCLQRPIYGYAHCVKHILEDPNAPFAQCQHVAKNTSKRCTIPVPLKEPEPRYCASHKQALGLAPTPVKKTGVKRDRQKKAPGTGGKPLIAVLKKAGIGHSPHYLSRMSEGEDSESASSCPDDSDEQDVPLSSSDSEEEAVFDAFLAEAAADEPDVDMLKDSGVITEEELVRRRQAKVRRLLKLYKMQFTRLRGVLRLKHRRLVREKQRRLEAPQRKEQQKEQQKEQEITLTPAQKEKAALKDKSALSYHAGKASKAIAEKAFAEKSSMPSCNAPGCSLRSLPLVKFCFAHILLDPNQKLFKACPYSCQDGRPCGYPTVISAEYCTAHLELASREPKKERKRKAPAGEGRGGQRAKTAPAPAPAAAAAAAAAAPAPASVWTLQK